MKKKSIALMSASAVIAAGALAACSSGSTAGSTTTIVNKSPASAAAAPAQASVPASSAPAAPAGGSAAAGVVLPIDHNPIVNTATDQTLAITYAAVEDNVDPATGKAIDDNLELTLKNTGTVPLTGLEVYYEMTDVVTGATEGYYQALDGITIAPGQETTVFFDNKSGVGHYPDNQFSLYRTSANEVDFTIQVSAKESAIATATAMKSANTGEQAD
ncbi:MAG: hypothetical protein GC156_03045 [Actinomycetales bacterium]|nr:hypothetical protein [Actinomycetales bacterium]